METRKNKLQALIGAIKNYYIQSKLRLLTCWQPFWDGRHNNQDQIAPEIIRYDSIMITKSEFELFEKYGVDKLPLDVQETILKYKRGEEKYKHLNSLEECEEYVIDDVNNILSWCDSKGGYGSELFPKYIGLRLKTIEFWNTISNESGLNPSYYFL